ncbi:hypothetical protein ACQPW3_29100 [Actinosynnema sp. CA-248983]
MYSTRRLAVLATAAVSGAALGAAVLTGVAQAYTLDPVTGTGFVGKGEVQTPFGWNNAALQANAPGVSFTLESVRSYSAVCTWTTGEGTKGEKTHDVTHRKTSAVSSVVSYDARQRNQVTGFVLTGFSSVVETGEAPVVGGACPGNAGHGGTWTSVVEGASSSGLYARHGTMTALLTPTV